MHIVIELHFSPIQNLDYRLMRYTFNFHGSAEWKIWMFWKKICLSCHNPAFRKDFDPFRWCLTPLKVSNRCSYVSEGKKIIPVFWVLPHYDVNVIASHILWYSDNSNIKMHLLKQTNMIETVEAFFDVH